MQVNLLNKTKAQIVSTLKDRKDMILYVYLQVRVLNTCDSAICSNLEDSCNFRKSLLVKLFRKCLLIINFRLRNKYVKNLKCPCLECFFFHSQTNEFHLIGQIKLIRSSSSPPAPNNLGQELQNLRFFFRVSF